MISCNTLRPDRFEPISDAIDLELPDITATICLSGAYYAEAHVRATAEACDIPMNSEHHTAAPLDVFYVVETTGQVSGERHHRVRSLLFETPCQADKERTRLQIANTLGTFSIWKGTTYIEPAEWSYDVVMADGTVIRSRRGKLLPGPYPGEGTMSCS
jgi:hypothetical protein